MACRKRRYGSKRAARAATAKVHNRIRVYFCTRCHAYHTTSEIKRERKQ